MFLAHEIAHVLGASDKYDRKGLPKIPEGLVDPQRDPLYPQTHGELMTRGVPLAEDNIKPFEHLSEAKIGPTTAHEVGWAP